MLHWADQKMKALNDAISGNVARVTANPFVTFANGNRSLTLLFVSIILTAVIASPSLLSLVIHLIDYAVLFAMRWQAHRKHGSTTSILMLISLGLTALMTEFTSVHVEWQLVNAGILSLMWAAASGEADRRMKAEAALAETESHQG